MRAKRMKNEVVSKGVRKKWPSILDTDNKTVKISDLNPIIKAPKKHENILLVP